MMRIVFIRHGMTKGNEEKRYIGRTNEELCTEGRKKIINNINLDKNFYPEADIIFLSPMRRCTQTSQIIYPDKKYVIIDEFKEIDFGDFEGKNYIELNGNSDYQKWIDSGGKMTFPNGESRQDFSLRCKKGFIKALDICMEYIKNQKEESTKIKIEYIKSQKKESAKIKIDFTAAFIVHGGTIMSVMEQFEKERLDYYAYQCNNGNGFICELIYNGNNIILITKGKI